MQGCGKIIKFRSCVIKDHKNKDIIKGFAYTTHTQQKSYVLCIMYDNTVEENDGSFYF